MMMIKITTTKISKIDITFSNPNLTFLQQFYPKKLFHSNINYSKQIIQDMNIIHIFQKLLNIETDQKIPYSFLHKEFGAAASNQYHY